MPIPMLADFAIRLAGGLAILLPATPWRIVPPAFFRTHCLVILGMLVLAALDVARSGGSGAMLAAVIAGAVLAYFASIAWGLGLPRLGVPLSLAIALTAAGVLTASSRSAGAGLWALNASGKISSAFLMGSTLTAMLLGHHYLTAPAMSIDPLRRFVRCMGWGIAARAVVAAVGLWFWQEGRGVSIASAQVSPFFLAVRWGVGVAGLILATALAWRTVRIRSTQSATGILYIAMTFVLFGELTALIISRDAGVAF